MMPSNHYNGSVDGFHPMMFKLNLKTYNVIGPLHMLVMNVKKKVPNAIIYNQKSLSDFENYFGVRHGFLVCW